MCSLGTSALDPQCLYVTRYLEAQNNIRDIERDARPMHDFFSRHIQAMQVPNTPPDDWISQDSYMELQALARTPFSNDRRIALGVIIVL